MITDKRKITIELMVSNYRKQVATVGIDNVDITLEKYLEGMQLTSEEVAYGAMVYYTTNHLT